MATGTRPYAYLRNARHACIFARNESRPQSRALLPLPPRRALPATSRTITSRRKSPNTRSPLCHSSGIIRDRRLAPPARYATTVPNTDQSPLAATEIPCTDSGPHDVAEQGHKETCPLSVDNAELSTDPSNSSTGSDGKETSPRASSEEIEIALNLIKNNIIIREMKTIKLPDQSFHCSFKITVPRSRFTWSSTVTCGSRQLAKVLVLESIIPQLKKDGLWTQLMRKERALRAVRINVDDDLLLAMRFATKDLLQAETVSMSRKKIPIKPRAKRRMAFSQSPQQARERSQYLMKALKRIHKTKTNPQRRVLREAIDGLPVWKHERQILDIINNHTYCLIAGETGSGKSTQIPQMVLDQATRRQAGADIRVLCVQPRRIAASSLAQRVAHERGERIGDTVGFQVRFESHWPRTGGAITYCTTGIMLNLLQTSPQFLHSFSHIMLDEVHVRDVGIDFVMLLLKRLINQRQALGHSTPKVIVMSATLDLDLFSSYFSNKGLDGTMIPAPHLIIPGRSFPVEKHYLDEILQNLIRLYGSPDALAQFFNNPDTKYETANYLLEHYKHFSSGPPSDVALVLESLKAPPKQFPNASSEYEDPLIPYELLLATIVHILSTRDTGSVLAFLPGMKHILMVEEMLRSRGPAFGFSFDDENRFQILALHALLPEGQKNIAMKVPTGCRRVILATDIAEASVTFPDVKFVVDCGKAHEAVFDSKSRSRRLACSWISKSSAIQRAGRAGRVQPGEYFALYTEERHDGFRVTKSPEITRMDLQDVCLRAMVCAPDISVTELLKEAIESPDIMNVQAAMDSLRRLQAVDENDNITHLGHILSQLSIDPARAKLVILGIIFRCLDPLLIHGAMAESSLFRFQSTPDGKSLVVNELQSFAQASHSDHIGLINAFKAVRDVYMRSGRWEALDFCVKHYIHFPRYHETYLVSREILGKLSSAGLIRPDQANLDESYQFGGPELNTNSQNLALIKALLLHCMYPQIAVPSLAPSRLRSPYCDTETDKKTVINRGSSILRIPSTDPKQKYMPVQSLFIFSKKVDVGLDGVPFKALFDTSLIDPLTACLFGGRLQWNGQNISMGSCVNIPVLSADGRDDQGAHGVIELRKAIDRSLSASYQYLVMQQQNRPHRESHSAREAHFSVLSKAIKEIMGLELHQLSNQKDVREEINVY